MEFPFLGDHCQETSCKMLDFLPFRCDCCQKVYCKDHINYVKHSCNSSKLKSKDFQIPLCPLCNQPVPHKRNELPDASMSAHIDRDCQSDPAEERRRKIFTNKCSLKGCKNKEIIPFLCQKCNFNYCIRHRHETDHECDTIQAQQRSQASGTRNTDINSRRLQFFQNQKQTLSVPASRSNQSIQPQSMSESEALEQAIQLSLAESSNPRASNRNAREETEDEMLARVLAQSELEFNNRQQAVAQEKKDNCSIN